MNNKIKDAFDQVTAEKELIQETEDAVIQYMRKQDTKQPILRKTKKRNIGLVLAFIVVFVFSSLFVYMQPVSAVSINSNSSVEVYFNRFNRVVEVTSYDENGDPMHEELDIQHKPFDEVMENIFSEYETEEVYVTVASRNEEETNRMMEKLTPHQERMHNMHIYQSSEEIMQRARENQMPMGRMHAMYELEDSEIENDLSNIEEKSTKELMKSFDRHHQEMMRRHHNERPGGRMNGGHMNRR